MFCREANGNRQVGGELWRPSKGFGTNQRRMDNYHAPRRTGNEVRYIGNAYHLVRDARWRMLVAHVNSDHWKGELHDRLALPADADTALQLYEVADAAEHRELAEQLTAERQVTKYAEGRGEVVCWERIRRANHFLDAAYLATAAGNLAVTLAERPKQRVGLASSRNRAAAGLNNKPATTAGRGGPGFPHETITEGDISW